jgi:putative oxidoreductase
MNIFLWILKIAVAGILLQTLFFKFTGAPESIFIFSTLQVEPWGRWLSGVMELVASILILVPQTQILGALLAAGVMAGAIVSHLFILGIEVQGDGGLLFGLACVVLICSSIVAGLKILPMVRAKT